MKKFAMVAITLVIGTGVAFASSMGLPWYVDNAPNNAFGSAFTGILSLVFLHNNTDETMTVSIEYFRQDGKGIGPKEADGNTFTVDPNASIAARLARDDTDIARGGQEDPVAGGLVPNRPFDPDVRKFNGSAVFRWIGAPSDLTGQITSFVGFGDGTFAAYQHLLPAGAYAEHGNDDLHRLRFSTKR